MAHEVFEDAVFVGGQGQGLLVQRRLLAVEVEHQRAGGNGRLGEAAGAAQQGVQACLEFFELKRLDQVVVGTGGQALDLVLPVAAGGEDENGEGLVLAAQARDQLQPTDAGQAQVDDGQVEVVLPGLVQRLLGIGDRLDHMAAFAQAGVEVMAKQGFVLDHQQFHVQLLDMYCLYRPFRG
ncbi:hypothetical protein D3C79_699820 [compost metagenome]